jgi:hypothetical protein
MRCQISWPSLKLATSTGSRRGIPSTAVPTNLFLSGELSSRERQRLTEGGRSVPTCHHFLESGPCSSFEIINISSVSYLLALMRENQKHPGREAPNRLSSRCPTCGWRVLREYAITITITPGHLGVRWYFGIRAFVYPSAQSQN